MGVNPTLNDPVGLTADEEIEFASLNGLPTTKHNTETTGRLHELHQRKFNAAAAVVASKLPEVLRGLQAGVDIAVLEQSLKGPSEFRIPNNRASLSAELDLLIVECDNHRSNASSVASSASRLKSEAGMKMADLAAEWVLMSPTSGPEWKIKAELRVVLNPLATWLDQVSRLEEQAMRVHTSIQQSSYALKNEVDLRTHPN